MTHALHSLLALVLATLLGCGTAAPEPNPSGQAYAFPHPEGFDAGAAHGLPWIESPEGCDQCHRSAQRIRMVDSCGECHRLYPHTEGFAEAEAHGGYGSSKAEACTPCHGTGEARPAEQEDSACRDCHQAYPHRVTYKEPWIHGPEALADPQSCARCHGADWQGSDHADACLDCHALYPHDSGRLADDSGLVVESWALPRAHGDSALEQGNAACGGTCHGEDFAGGLSEVACFDCHAAYPHSVDIRVEHRELMHQLGEASCLGCHVSNMGFSATFGCTEACHGTTP